VRFVVGSIWRVTCQASKDGLPERTEGFCTSIELLSWSVDIFGEDEQHIHMGEPRARRLRAATDLQ
jgi:hypothetical protein